MTVLPIPHMISPTTQPDGAKKEMGHIIIIEPHSVSVFMHNRYVCIKEMVLRRSVADDGNIVKLNYKNIVTLFRPNEQNCDSIGFQQVF